VGVQTNFEALEGSVNGELTIPLTRRSRRVIITNDSSTKDLEYKFKASQDYGTLKPTETIALDFNPKFVLLRTTAAVDYRIWSYG